MNGIILAGGTGKRLNPFTRVTNKHLLPVGDKPMILHAIHKLVSASVNRIMVITGTEHMGDMISLLGSGREWGAELSYRVQDTPDGIAGALKLAKNFVREEDCVVILGDNIFEDSLKKPIEKFKSRDKNKTDCMLLLKEVTDAERFGVATICENKIIKIVEKPQFPESNLCVTGIYCYSSSVFNIINDIDLSDRGEYEISDVNNYFVERGLCEFDLLKGWWTDAGTMKSYHIANQLIWDNS